MSDLRFTLISDGRSDRALTRVLRWLLISNGVSRPVQGSWADLGNLWRPPKRLHDTVATALRFYPCELLFVHRDAEKGTLEDRQAEIQRAVQRACRESGQIPPMARVVPVRMTEAWFLFDEFALRSAAGNPHGRIPLDLPSTAQIERIGNPKKLLRELIVTASGLTGRRQQKLRPEAALHRLADLITDYGPLGVLPAFSALTAEVRSLIAENGWRELE